MKAIKITNPTWIGTIAHRIQMYMEKVDVSIIRYETLYAYFVESIQRGFLQKQQHGAELEEFWVVQDDNDEVVAFAHWYKLTLPFDGCVNCDHIYSWGTKREGMRLLAQELIEFTKRVRCPNIYSTLVNQIVANHFMKVCKEFGYILESSETINVLIRRK